MADRHPYVNAMGHLVQVTNHLRRSFPTVITADTLKKLGFAPQNESYVLNVLRFLGLIDQEGKKTGAAARVFSIHDDGEFATEFGKLVSQSYADLFELHGEGAWNLNTDTLISYFRTTDGSTALVGKLQAATFQRMAAIAGHGNVPEPKPNAAKPASSSQKQKPGGVRKTQSKQAVSPVNNTVGTAEHLPNVGLTVRIEINLPSDGDQETYDRIFKSIRRNLLNE